MGIKRHTERSLTIISTDMEISYRKKTFPDSQSVLDLKHKICCTACGRNLMKEIQTGLLCTHPSLEVIICKECLQFYGDGLFKTDKKGDDVYCRWCAQGGTIYCCSKCSVAFCKKCIDRNLKTDKKVMTDINKDTWACFICVSKPLWYLRAFCWAVKKYKKDLTDESRKRKLSTSSAESVEKFTKPSPASAKKSFSGPASKKPKVEASPVAQKKPGPASKTITKRPGPASMTKRKQDSDSEEKTPAVRTRHKKLDVSPKIIFPTSQPKRQAPKRASVAAAKKTAVKKPTPRRRPKSRIIPDVSSDEEFDDFEDEKQDDDSLDGDMTGAVESVMQEVLDFCFKLSNNFNTKLIKYKLFYKGNVSTSDKVNNACVNLHMDLKKITRLYTAIDEKMMMQLDEFNAAQQALENEKLELSESIAEDIDVESYGISASTPPEPEVVDENEGEEEAKENDESVQETDDTTMIKDNKQKGETMDIIDVTDKQNEVELNAENNENKQANDAGNGEIVDNGESVGNENEQSSEKEVENKESIDEVTHENVANSKEEAEKTKETVEDKVENIQMNSSDAGTNDVTDESQVNSQDPSLSKIDFENEVDDSLLQAEQEEGTNCKADTIGNSDDTNGEKDAGDPMDVEDSDVKKNESSADNADSAVVKTGENEDQAVMESDLVNPEKHEASDKTENTNDVQPEDDSMYVCAIEPKENQNGSSNPAQDEPKNDIDGLSDISDKSDQFTDGFDKVGTKEAFVPKPVENHSNGHIPTADVSSN